MPTTHVPSRLTSSGTRAASRSSLGDGRDRGVGTGCSGGAASPAAVAAGTTAGQDQCGQCGQCDPGQGADTAGPRGRHAVAFQMMPGRTAGILPLGRVPPLAADPLRARPMTPRARAGPRTFAYCWCDDRASRHRRGAPPSRRSSTMSLFRRLTVLAGRGRGRPPLRPVPPGPGGQGPRLPPPSSSTSRPRASTRTRSPAPPARRRTPRASRSPATASARRAPPRPPRPARSPGTRRTGGRCRRADAAHPAAAPGVPAAEPGASARRLTPSTTVPAGRRDRRMWDVDGPSSRRRPAGHRFSSGPVTCQDRR